MLGRHLLRGESVQHDAVEWAKQILARYGEAPGSSNNAQASD